jgi:ATP-dependent helicase/nuclease subunit B
MAAAEITFLGWDTPLTPGVRDFLLRTHAAGSLDLTGTLVVVPTRQAGRRLLDSLALECSRRGGGVLSATVDTPAIFFRPSADDHVAPPAEVSSAWLTLFRKVPACRHLFPHDLPGDDPQMLLDAADTIQHLRDELADEGLTISRVLREHAATMEEPGRWADLERLEAAYLNVLSALRATGPASVDPVSFKLARASQPVLPAGITRIVVAAVPDPAGLMLASLRQLGSNIHIDVLVHAPASLVDRFDEWGRPIPDAWREAAIDIPDPTENVRLAASPADQARLSMDLIKAGMRTHAPQDTTIAIPDPAVVRHMEAVLKAAQIATYDPADKPVATHPLGELVLRFCRLLQDGSYGSVAAFLRHPHTLDHLAFGVRIQSDKLLTELDEYQQEHLPVSLDDMRSLLESLSALPVAAAGARNKDLTKALTFLKGLMAGGLGAPLPAIRRMLSEIYSRRHVDRSIPDEAEFIQVAGEISERLFALEKVSVSDPVATLHLLIREVRSANYHPRRSQLAEIELDGWLELPWNDAPLLIVTGMNEGFVPDSIISDAFLPDSMKHRLGLRDDSRRLARDAYLMTSLIEARRARPGGRVCFIAGKTGATGDPLKPSRLLFRCKDAELAERAARLFDGNLHVEQANPPFSISFKLNPASAKKAPVRSAVRPVSITAFRDYLACPFRYHLRHQLGMRPLADDAGELDALAFGTLVHEPLKRLAAPDLSDCSDAGRLQAALETRVEDLFRHRFGEHPSLAVEIAFESARQRLAKVAEAQAALVSEGWRIVHTEYPLEFTLGGMAVKGRVDRIDRHEDGRWRVIDYKTSDEGKKPEDVHLATPGKRAGDFACLTVGKKERRWADLQLPLYREGWRAAGQDVSNVELAYFNIPKALADTRVEGWGGASTALMDSAVACAGEVLARIGRGEFWPPNEEILGDDFERLLSFGKTSDYFEQPVSAAGGTK